MGSRREVILPDDLVSLCEEHGRKIVEGYASGRNAASRAVSSHGAENDPILQAKGKMAEVAFCLWAGLDPIQNLNWSENVDKGFDVHFHNYKLDIKWIRSGYHFLIWPVNKRRFYLDTRFGALVLVRGDGPSFCIHKWITKAGFFCEKQIAPDPMQKGITPGTWFMEDKNLWDIGYLCELTRHGEAA